MGALDTEIELKLRREGQRSAPATARCFLFTNVRFGRVLRGDCDSLQASKQKLLPSRPQSHAFVCYGDASCHANHHPSLTILALSASPIGRVFTWCSARFINTFTNNTLVAHFMYSSSSFPENIITPRVPEAPAHQANKQPLQDRQFPRKHSIPCLLAPGTRNTHSMESAFCNSSKKRLSGYEVTRDPAAWLCGLAALAGLAAFVCPRAD